MGMRTPGMEAMTSSTQLERLPSKLLKAQDCGTDKSKKITHAPRYWPGPGPSKCEEDLMAKHELNRKQLVGEVVKKLSSVTGRG